MATRISHMNAHDDSQVMPDDHLENDHSGEPAAYSHDWYRQCAENLAAIIGDHREYMKPAAQIRETSTWKA